MRTAVIAFFMIVGHAPAQEPFSLFRNGPIDVVVQERFGATDNVTLLPQDEIWLIDARNAHCAGEDLCSLNVSCCRTGRWTSSDLETLIAQHAADRSKVTFLLAHGNQTDKSWARSRGLQVYNNAFSTTSECRPPVRFVILAWRSERELLRNCRDYIYKSQRSVAVGRALATILCQFEDRRMVLVGFSLGVQVLVSALDHPMIQHDVDETKGQFRVSLIAPALDGEFACAQLHQHPSNHAVARTDIFTNSIDRALRLSKVARRKQCRDGDVSIACLVRRGNLPLNGVRIRDLANEVGRKHAVVRYSDTPSVRNGLNKMLNEVYLADAVQVLAEPLPANSALMPESN